ncbi:MAG TPA: C69 family dipeptidase [Candidatus Aminicenantes bacterium]|nr:C69 family dipeptidase [Candidatus Aminicenantes bacterium]
MKKPLVILLLLPLAISCLAAAEDEGCTVIAVGRKASADGSVILSHTDAGPDSRIYVVPAARHRPGTKAPVLWGIQDPARPLRDDGEVLGTIPQAAETYAYIHSAYPHMNEHQLAIAESTINQRPELAASRENGRQIMTVEQAEIFALQRCRKARDAVKLIGALMESHGFLPSSGDGGEDLVIGDPQEAWVMEIFGVGPGWSPESGRPGAIWAAQRLGDDQALVIPNWSIIKEIRPGDAENFMVSANYMQEAVDRGWYDPASGKPFVWQDVYAPLPVEFATSRFWLFYTTFMPNLARWPERKLGADPMATINPYHQFVEPLSLYPFSAAPERKISLRDVIAFQRSVFAGTIYDFTAQPQWLVSDGKGGLQVSPLATPFPGSDLRALLKLSNRRPVARHRGHYGMVCQLRSWLPDAVGGVYWVYQDNPYISPYVPVYAGCTDTAPCYQTYEPERYSDRSARWTIDAVDNLCSLRFQDAAREVQAMRNPFEEKIFADQGRVEQEALARFRRSPEKARAFLTAYCRGLMDQVPPLYIRMRERLLTRFTNNRE